MTYALLDLKGWRTAEGEQPWVTVEPPRLAGDLSMQDRTTRIDEPPTILGLEEYKHLA